MKKESHLYYRVNVVCEFEDGQGSKWKALAQRGLTSSGCPAEDKSVIVETRALDSLELTREGVARLASADLLGWSDLPCRECGHCADDLVRFKISLLSSIESDRLDKRDPNILR